MVGIEDIKYYLPRKRLTNQELEQKFEFDESFLSLKLGIHERPVADNGEACSDLAFKACRKIFEEGKVEPHEIGLLILCTQNSDYKLPHTSAILQDRLKLSKHIIAFDINLGCSGFVYSIAVAKAIMNMFHIKKGFVITSDPYSKIIHSEDRDCLPIFGDAATATLLSEDGFMGIMDFTFGTEGSSHKELIVKEGGSRYPIGTNDVTSEALRSRCLYMNGRSIFNFAMTNIPDDIKSCLKRNNLRIEEIDYFVFHQGSKYLLDCLAKGLNVDKSKVIYSLNSTGNTVSSSIPIALAPYLNENRKLNKKYLISGFGVGLSWASSVLVT